MALPQTLTAAPRTWLPLITDVTDSMKVTIQNKGATTFYLGRGDVPPADLDGCIELDPGNGFAGVIVQNVITGAQGGTLYGFCEKGDLAVLVGYIPGA